MTVVAPAWQRLEGVALLAVAILAYAELGQGWQLFVVLFLAPDLSFAGYLAGPRAGAWAYNLAHSLIGPLLLGAAGLLGGVDLATGLALIWLAHVGFDRALGYGLKASEGFEVTHLGLIGAARRAAQQRSMNGSSAT